MSKKPGSHQLAKPNQQTAVSQQVTAAAMFSGPLPHPEILEGYDQIQSGFAQRIVTLAEREAAHRQEIEKISAQQNVEAMRKTLMERRIGQIFAFIVALAAITGAVYCASIGAYAVGSVIAGTAAVGMVSAFLYIRKK